LTVIPAKAGIHCADRGKITMDSGLRRNDGKIGFRRNDSKIPKEMK
jgi:hypothetical protein